jgi:hypothetical protein
MPIADHSPLSTRCGGPSWKLAELMMLVGFGRSAEFQAAVNFRAESAICKSDTWLTFTCSILISMHVKESCSNA